MKKLNQQTTTLAKNLLFGMGILLSGNAFAAPPANPNFVTHTELDSAIGGIQLLPGPKGEKGDTGSQGIPGPAGAVGATGSQGSIGLTGAAGATGVPGSAGAIGPQGPAGDSAVVHVIGETYAGGKVFYVDDTGQHGLIAALADQNGGAGVQWYNAVYRNTGTTGDGLYAGAMNTAMIIATQIDDNPASNFRPLADFAAKVAADYSVQENGVTPCTVTSGNTLPPVDEICYGDWYLPSKVELNLLHQQRGVFGDSSFYGVWYWSSTEKSLATAWHQVFYDGSPEGGDGDKRDSHIKVRAVRAF